MPTRIVVFDQRNLLRPGPALDLLLTFNCPRRRIMQFIKHKLINRVALREGTAFPLPSCLDLDEPERPVTYSASVSPSRYFRHGLLGVC